MQGHLLVRHRDRTIYSAILLSVCLLKNIEQTFTLFVKALLHGAIFHATCLAMALRDKLHESLHRLTCLAMVKIFARQVA
jgi:hypothetical protein